MRQLQVLVIPVFHNGFGGTGLIVVVEAHAISAGNLPVSGRIVFKIQINEIPAANLDFLGGSQVVASGSNCCVTCAHIGQVAVCIHIHHRGIAATPVNNRNRQLIGYIPVKTVTQSITVDLHDRQGCALGNGDIIQQNIGAVGTAGDLHKYLALGVPVGILIAEGIALGFSRSLFPYLHINPVIIPNHLNGIPRRAFAGGKHIGELLGGSGSIVALIGGRKRSGAVRKSDFCDTGLVIKHNVCLAVTLTKCQSDLLPAACQRIRHFEIKGEGGIRAYIVKPPTSIGCGAGADRSTDILVTIFFHNGILCRTGNGHPQRILH